MAFSVFLQQALHVRQCTYCAELAAKPLLFKFYLILIGADDILETEKVGQQAAEKAVFYSNQLQRIQKTQSQMHRMGIISILLR